ncbi:hypothetical protein [Rhizobium mongolense]|uniref:Uncharacterized protein n=2 Tax=Rhizobium mongolense TaxID=57676 RepID=A0ABR6ISX1_9HYPH|nr:hypothetical protein [Rhizobium mongolense]MBB4231007.1 hypothetical protein [Rhizobium mongolense]TVZ66162.1 hypothetical protein BCL32_6514 [Rhizobium mongolense USDA 1844]
MNYSEGLVADWLTRQRCHWIYVDQENYHHADGVKRSDPGRPLHRPDLLAFLDGFGSIAIDVKDYELKHRVAKFDVLLPNDEEYSFEDKFSWIDISWSEIIHLQNFQNVSNIPTWICIINTKNSTKGETYWFRVDKIFNSYGRLFFPSTMAAYELADIPEVRYFDDWPSIKLQSKSYGSTSDDYFPLLVSDDDSTDGLLTEYAEELYVRPSVLNIQKKTSLKDLIQIRNAELPNEVEPTRDQFRYAYDIAKALNLDLPAERTKTAFRDFIKANEATFQMKKRGTKPSWK